MKDRTACFSGHRPEKLPYGGDENHPFTQELKSMLHLYVSEAVSNGYTRFVSGMARGVDLWACECVLALKRHHPALELVCALPYAGCGEVLRGLDRIRFNDFLSKASEVYTVSPAYDRDCMRRRNRSMVDRASLLIAVCADYRSGTGQTIRYARQQGLTVRLITVDTRPEPRA